MVPGDEGGGFSNRCVSMAIGCWPCRVTGKAGTVHSRFCRYIAAWTTGLGTERGQSFELAVETGIVIQHALADGLPLATRILRLQGRCAA